MCLKNTKNVMREREKETPKKRAKVAQVEALPTTSKTVKGPKGSNQKSSKLKRKTKGFPGAEVREKTAT